MICESFDSEHTSSCASGFSPPLQLAAALAAASTWASQGGPGVLVESVEVDGGRAAQSAGLGAAIGC